MTTPTRWAVGEREPRKTVRAVTDAHGHTWFRSPHGFFWYPAPSGGRIVLWDVLLAAVGPLTEAQTAPEPLTLF